MIRLYHKEQEEILEHERNYRLSLLNADAEARRAQYVVRNPDVGSGVDVD